MVPRIAKGGHSFKGAYQYFFHDKGQSTQERVLWTRTENMLTDDPDLAWKVMAYTALEQNRLKEASGQKATGRKLQKPVFSYSLAWHPEQNPDQDHMLDTARKSLAALDLSDYETLIVAHRDEPQKHVHIIVIQVCSVWPAVVIGMFLPIYLPLILLAIGFVARNARVILTGWAVGQAELIAALVVIAYKALTGRTHPPRHVGPDISHVFYFGFLRGGVFWGWPSSHTTIAFAMAVTVFMLFPKQRWLGIVAIFYACYIGVGVSMTIHWFSDFAAGAIIGSVIGTVVGKSFGSNSAQATRS